MPTVWPRNEVFDFGIVPLSPSLSSANSLGLPPSSLGRLSVEELLILGGKLCRNFSPQSRVDPREWLEVASSTLNLSQRHALLLADRACYYFGVFDTFQILSASYRQPKALGSRAPDTTPVFLGDFLVYLYAQSFMRMATASRTRLSPNEEWPSSPQHVKGDDEDSVLWLQQGGINALLRLLSFQDDDNAQVTPEALDQLDWVIGAGPSHLMECKLSLVYPFSGRSSAPILEIEEWFAGHLETNPIAYPGRKSSSVPTSPESSALNLSNDMAKVSIQDQTEVKKPFVLNNVRHTIIIGPDQVKTNDMIKVYTAKGAYIYILASASYVLLSNLKKCTIVVGASSRVLRLDNCDSVKIIAACHACQISNCTDCTFHLLVNTPPLVSGRTRNLLFAPHNTTYPGMATHLSDAFLHARHNFWATPVIAPSTAGPTEDNEPVDPDAPSTPTNNLVTAVVRIVPAEEFTRFVVPVSCSEPVNDKPLTTDDQNGEIPDGLIIPVPTAYAQALEARANAAREAQRCILEAGLDSEAEANLRRALEREFHGWLHGAGMARQISDLTAATK